MIAVAGARLKMAALCGWVAGFLFYVFTLSWLDTTFQLHGGVGPFMAAFTVALISAVAALYRLAFAWCFAWLCAGISRSPALPRHFLWIASEFGLYSMPAIGFPWNLLGYAAAHSLALLQLAPIAGVWGLGFLIAGFNALLFWSLAGLSRAGSACRWQLRRRSRRCSYASRHSAIAGCRKQYPTAPRGWCKPISRSRIAFRRIGFSSTREK